MIFQIWTQKHNSMPDRVNGTKKQISKLKILSPQFWTPSFFITITKFLTLTTVPTCNSQNRIATTISYVFFPLHPSFISPRAILYSILTVTITVISGLPSQVLFNFQSISNWSGPHAYSRSSTDRLNTVFLTLWEGGRGGLGGSVYKVHSSVR